MNNIRTVVATMCMACAVTQLPAEVTPQTVQYEVKPMYGFRKDKAPGRIVNVKLQGGELSGKFTVEAKCGSKKEKKSYNITGEGESTVEFLLPKSVGVDKDETVVMTLRADGKEFRDTIEVPQMRQFTVYLFNHSHVDIGYTNTHKNIETLHKNNVIEGMRLGQETENYPDGVQMVWNPEVTWPIERLWNSQPELRDSIISAIKLGHIAVDASYVNLNTSICADEELFHLFGFSRKMQELSGKDADVFAQFDIPGISWGLVPVLANQGIKYVMSWTNGGDRIGHAREGLDGKPFWWVGPDGKSKVLFFQPGNYANSGSMGKGGETGRPWLGQRNAAKVPRFIKMGYANVDFTKQLTELQNSDYPYDFACFSWTLWDNNPIDADIPDAVKEWNEKYAYPHIKISSAHEIMKMVDERYGDKLPVVSGDYTEYWTDGLGTAAVLTAANRHSKERMIQVETVASLLADQGVPAPRTDIEEAWRHIILGSEHTWCFENPNDAYFSDAILNVKKSYFEDAEKRSLALLDEVLAPVTDKANGAFGPYDGPAEGGVTVINTHSWPHGGIVTLPYKESMRGNRVVDDSGNEVLCQRLASGELVFLANETPAFGTTHYTVVSGDCSVPTSNSVSKSEISNGVVKVNIDTVTGNITSLRINGSDYNYINKGANQFVWLPANVDEPQTDKVVSIEITENGPLVSEVTVTSEARGCNSLTRSVRLIAGQPWVEISNTVDKQATPDKESIHFGFDFNIPQAVINIDIPWGVMQPEKDQWKQANRNWMVLQRWADISNDTHGVTWCSLDAPLMEYGGRFANIATGWGNGGDWKYSLPEHSAEIYSWAMNNHWHTNFPQTQEGKVTFSYRMMPHGASDLAAANRFGMEQAQPLVHVIAKNATELKAPVAIDNSNVVVSIVKDQGDGKSFIVRLRSLSDKEENVTMTYPRRTPASVHICDLGEEPSRPADGTLTLPPYGMTTLLLKW